MLVTVVCWNMAKPTTGIFNDKVFMENNPNKLFDTHYDIIDAVRIRRKSYVWNRQTFLTTHTGGKKETSSSKRVLYVGLTKVQGECNTRKNCQVTLVILMLVWVFLAHSMPHLTNGCCTACDNRR